MRIRWFGQYVGVACWPILSALIVRIVLAIGLSGLYAASAVGHVCVALALGLCAFAVPVVSNALVGGSVTTAAQHGFKIAHGHATSLVSAASGAARKFSRRGNGNEGQEAPDESDESAGNEPTRRLRSVQKPPQNPPSNPDKT